MTVYVDSVAPRAYDTGVVQVEPIAEYVPAVTETYYTSPTNSPAYVRPGTTVIRPEPAFAEPGAVATVPTGGDVVVDSSVIADIRSDLAPSTEVMVVRQK